VSTKLKVMETWTRHGTVSQIRQPGRKRVLAPAQAPPGQSSASAPAPAIPVFGYSGDEWPDAGDLCDECDLSQGDVDEEASCEWVFWTDIETDRSRQ
jgi:hypothetical protein